MLNYNDKLYLLSSIESIVKGNETLNLDNHILEFDLRPMNYEPKGNLFCCSQDAGIMLSVKMRNKQSSEVVYSKVFFKTLMKNCADKVIAKRYFEHFINESEEEKIDFITSFKCGFGGNHLYKNGRINEKVDFLDELVDKKTGIIFVGGILSDDAKKDIDSKMSSCEYNEAIVYKMTM